MAPAEQGVPLRYVALQTAVKAKYDLWMTQAEHDAIKNILTSSCPDQPVPADNGGVAVPVAVKEKPKPEPEPEAPVQQEAPADVATGGDDRVITSFANCSEVKAAGVAPIRVDDPGWDSKFDRDGDGVGCES